MVVFNLKETEKIKAFTIVLKKKQVFEKQRKISELTDLQGKSLDFYSIPPFKNYGYIDCEQLLIPVWVYLVCLISFAMPVIALLVIDKL